MLNYRFFCMFYNMKDGAISVNVNKIDTNAWTKQLFNFINVLFIIFFSYYFALNIFGNIYKFIF